MAGRASGKTLTGAHWCRTKARAGTYGAIVGATSSDARRTMVKGKSGILRVSPRWDSPRWYHTDQTLTWQRPDGLALATLYTADEPERMRGPEHDWAWVDELCAHKNSEAWDQLLMTMRGSERPQILITTTPKRSALLLDLLERETDGLAITIGSTDENTALPEAYLKKLLKNYEGTRTGRQELGGELLSDVDGALWTLDMVQDARVDEAPDMQRVVIGVDPAGGSLCGISVCGIDGEGTGYVLADLSVSGRPETWAQRVAWAFDQYKADVVVAEKTHGGAMVETTLRTGNENLPLKLVDAKRGKFLRAEPVSRLYEQHRVRHVLGKRSGEHPDPAGHLAKLEDQLTTWTPDARGSPDRMDALVYALTELMLGGPEIVML